MATYDLHILQPSEFEEITRDLLQKEWNCPIESFTSGRDGGIDLRCTAKKGGKAIIQAKRYKDYKSLLANLKGEVVKVRKLNPNSKHKKRLKLEIEYVRCYIYFSSFRHGKNPAFGFLPYPFRYNG